ncbi:undecaprenyldiphospho-muramoylpentapeptide beta-N-acetylglucosaminyltransferase [Dietzia cinnamea]|uniref:UDP-N-acetylglucosamine--N-acetylmuramyl-(pentapeptide) pyrophosphoryl-undecaprenol N-acetylglucosamine transferase n=4 Tax=Dietzia TaxID=37914 RepID=A0AAW5QCG9_9ACTN|nr:MULTISPECIES: undecaprenyldiphospho-muramoylpentapeptide beta-N-acetylglucosaminyltransferase [Dietzia]KZO58013.1 UDP-N-acetylglucosamine--N-acetylmuramyl-(pentapeptide) pyrophosphoryl-undecaprenol N-acetylglucosamine transferase [Dietzia maris]MBC7305822.1 undecaprenyldiphospho-muramoylpentapeptide beta-N-acetylglucosaminyltransferase [Dietzia sp.]MCT1865223.1 undecaprenyldiphospho-muramoylpentapeptide beta-N-acetylglucosaminyltransferase [Dietzia cinnamea]MCT2031161.1 undecaprenyldiphospho
MSAASTGGPSVLVVGGGTAGHIEPALAVGEAVTALDPTARVTAVGTPRGLETDLVPKRGVPLELVDPVPLPRSVGGDLFRLPGRLARAVRGAREVLRRTDADVVVGFGGYACVPVYLAAAAPLRPASGGARRRVPIVVHEANSRAGIANKLGARFAVATLAAVTGSGLDARVVGNPVRRAVATLDRAALRSRARATFGLDPDGPVLLVVGGSQGARSLNTAMAAVAEEFSRAGVGVLHAVGPKNLDDAPVVPAGGAPYVTVPYLDRMDLAYAAADLILCRSGAITVAEVSAVGLPAVFVPLPHGNGEQALNARDLVAGGAALLVEDADLTPDHLRSEVLPLALDPDRLQMMSEAAVRGGSRDAAEVVARIALDAAGKAPR